MKPLELAQQFDHRIFSYDRVNGNKAVVLQGISAVQQGPYQVTLDSCLSRNQTVLLAQGDDWEIVLELRPRQLSEKDKLNVLKK